MVLCYCCVSHGGPGRQFVPKGYHIYNCEFEDIGYGELRENYEYEELVNNFIIPIQKWFRKYKKIRN
tara:strand:- start:135 stop:335 length:201 start_codon:yes stop_codon:yes gene_type:complete